MASGTQRQKHEPLSVEGLTFLEGLRRDFDSVAEMISARAQEIPDRVHVLYYDQAITYAQTNERANRVANFLKEKGVEKGDIVSLMILNAPEVYYSLFGAQKAGAIAGSINFALKGPEIAYVLDDSKPKVVLVGSEFMVDFSKGYYASSHRPLVVEVRTEATHNIDFGQLFLSDILETYPTDEVPVRQKKADPFLLLYSSGTTGRPKGILLTNEGQLSVCRDMARLGVVSGDDIVLLLLPMFHANPICVWTYPMTYCGQTLCIRKAFTPADFWPAVTEYGVTILMGVPAMYNYVYYSIDPASVERKKLRLHWAFCGAAPLSVDLIKGFREKFNVEIIEGYGLTEGTGVATVNPPRGRRKPGSVGLPFPEQKVCIMDDDLNELPPGARGEICIKGPPRMLAYLNKPEATTETLQNGWLRTGDIGYMDEEGYFYVVGRKADMINRGGENIYPREIEMVLETHPDIVAVAVIGVRDEALGERVKAVIEPSQAGILSEEDVTAFLADKLAKYKIPEFVEFTTQMPRNPAGKIMKKQLKAIHGD